MKFDVNISLDNLLEVPALAREAEALGVDGLWTSETKRNPFLPLVLAVDERLNRSPTRRQLVDD